MIKIIAPHPNTPLPQLQRVLLVYKTWAGSNTPGHSWWDFRNYLIYFRANPRSLEYMDDIVREVLIMNYPNLQFDLLLDLDGSANPGLEDTLFSKAGRKWFADLSRPISWYQDPLKELPLSSYDAIICLYPDPLGLEFGELEKSFLRKNLPNVWVINGRRRFFQLDGSTLRTIRFHRFLTKSWLAEIIFALSIFIVAPVIAVFDWLSGRANQRFE
jgi:hypothetical protein